MKVYNLHEVQYTHSAVNHVVRDCHERAATERRYYCGQFLCGPNFADILLRTVFCGLFCGQFLCGPNFADILLQTFFADFFVEWMVLCGQNFANIFCGEYFCGCFWRQFLRTVFCGQFLTMCGQNLAVFCGDFFCGQIV